VLPLVAGFTTSGLLALAATEIAERGVPRRVSSLEFHPVAPAQEVREHTE